MKISHRRVRPVRRRAAREPTMSLDLPWDRDEDVAVRLVKPELLRRRQVAARVEAKSDPDQRLPRRNVGGADLAANLRPACCAVRACLVDSSRNDLYSRVRGSAEEITFPTMRLPVGRDDLRLRVEREVRVVDVRADG